MRNSTKKFFKVKSPFLPMALQSFLPVVRCMNVAYLSKAYLLKTVIDLNETDVLSRTVDLLKSALQTYTRDKHAIVQLAHLFQIQNKNKIAQEYFIKALAIDPNFPEANIKYKIFLEQ